MFTIHNTLQKPLVSMQPKINLTTHGVQDVNPILQNLGLGVERTYQNVLNAVDKVFMTHDDQIDCFYII